ncbi:hypothetical protein [Reichenbachiella versicolor]|uniref:hypothetical protein n=1 Tax=Reichenbachiella versicolor TaxID=1821036 RepID=UPI0013A58875|nr:hypothetical protein [Reichenbachiella versicolor]
MKHILGSIFLISLFLTGCYETHDELMQDRKGAGDISFPTISAINSSFFDSFDFDNAFVEFVVAEDTLGNTASIIVEKTFKGVTTEIGTFEDFPATVTVTAANAVSDIEGIAVSDLEVGDVFTFQVLTVSKSGIVSRSNAGVLNASVACKSSIAGTYTTVASGMSTDDGPTENPVTDYAYEVTLTDTGVNGVYEISDFSAGLFTLWYDIYGLSGDYPGTLQDVCNDVSIINTTGPFGSPISGTGSFDPDTGIITISGGAVSWGDNWTITMTPK